MVQTLPALSRDQVINQGGTVMDASDFVETASDDEESDDGLPVDMSPLTTAARGCLRENTPRR